MTVTNSVKRFLKRIESLVVKISKAHNNVDNLLENERFDNLIILIETTVTLQRNARFRSDGGFSQKDRRRNPRLKGHPILGYPAQII